jgi:hypothetical protein
LATQLFSPKHFSTILQKDCNSASGVYFLFRKTKQMEQMISYFSLHPKPQSFFEVREPLRELWKRKEEWKDGSWSLPGQQ